MIMSSLTSYTLHMVLIDNELFENYGVAFSIIFIQNSIVRKDIFVPRIYQNT